LFNRISFLIMKKVLILVLASDFPPYSKMIETSIETWDSVRVDGVETIFYCSEKDNPGKQNTDKVLYFPVGNTLHDMGHKNLAMFEWALENKEFDYVARVNASCYVNKKSLLQYVQDLSNENVFVGTECMSVHGFSYQWGGTQYILSKDVIQKIVDNKDKWNHKYMEDESISLLLRELGVPFSQGYSGAIDDMGDHWRCISYGEGESITFTDFSDLKKLNHHFYRVKIDGRRQVDEILMRELFKVLN
jgi:hypothetical protein